MKIITSQSLVDLSGKNMVDNQTKEILTIGLTISNLLSYSKSDNQYKSYLLAKKFATDEEIELESEDIAFIKKIINESGLAPLSGGQLIGILEGK